MPKAYWVATYRSVKDPDKLAAYAKLAGPAIQAAGGKFLARGNAAKAYEAGLTQRVVIIEFDSVEPPPRRTTGRPTRRRCACSTARRSVICELSKDYKHNPVRPRKAGTQGTTNNSENRPGFPLARE